MFNDAEKFAKKLSIKNMKIDNKPKESEIIPIIQPENASNRINTKDLNNIYNNKDSITKDHNKIGNSKMINNNDNNLQKGIINPQMNYKIDSKNNEEITKNIIYILILNILKK